MVSCMAVRGRVRMWPVPAEKKIHDFSYSNGSYTLQEPFFRSSVVRAPKWTGEALELALVLLCTVRLDGGMATLRGHAAVKTALESEQTRELHACPHPELRRQRLHIGAAGGSTRTLTGLFPRASPLNE